ncbi:MAG: hypothetical protein J0H97_03895 [Alphaproteobacteria bacterium]|jgi:hypothetical protein|nr:hypothetical protein [Alphaproteobacteria bacterium]
MGSLVVTFVVALVATWAATTSTSAMTLMVETIELPRAGGSVRSFVHRLKLTGPLESGDSDKLRDTLKTLEQLGDDHDGELATIELDSRGGALEEGLRMGRLFRRFGVTTIVRRNARCLSACALAFLGGATVAAARIVPSRRLEIGGQLGFHAFYAGREDRLLDTAASRAKGVAEGRAASAMIIAYAAEMGADPGLLARALIRPPEDMTYIIRVKEFVALNVCPIGLARPRSALAEQAANLCSNATAGLLVQWSDLMHEYTAREARNFLLGEVGRGITAANVRKGLGTRLEEIMRSGNETAKDLAYGELAAAGVALPSLRDKTFHMEDVRLGPRTLECLASLSSHGEGYGVVLITSRGIAAPPNAAPPSCPDLFLHAPDDLINLSPRP